MSGRWIKLCRRCYQDRLRDRRLKAATRSFQTFLCGIFAHNQQLKSAILLHNLLQAPDLLASHPHAPRHSSLAQWKILPIGDSLFLVPLMSLSKLFVSRQSAPTKRVYQAPSCAIICLQMRTYLLCLKASHNRCRSTLLTESLMIRI